MQFSGSKIITGSKFVYLIVFFALLSGMFYPIIAHASWDGVIGGTLILFLGLTGTVILYKAGTTDRHKRAYLIIGLALTGLALFLIYAAIGRV